MRGIIYKYTSPSGKCYIGQTNQESKRKYRFENLKQSYGSPKIDNARKKYGPKAFVYEILFEFQCNSKEELRKILGEKEIFYIEKYNSISNGYNHQPGGLHQINVISKESRKRMALKVSKTVLQYNLEGQFIQEWQSTMEIERQLKINHTLISQNCLGKTRHCREFIFKYKECDIIIEQLLLEEKVIPNQTRRLGICQLDLEGNEIKRWASITKASNELHICRHKLKELATNNKEYEQNSYKLISK